MSELGDKPDLEPDTSKAISDALESVERLEREAKELDDVEESVVEIEESEEGGARDAILEQYVSAKNELQQTLAQTQKEALSMKDRLTRVSADFDNYKKRQAREQQDAKRFANESLLKDLMPVIDNLNRATDAANAHEQTEAVKTVVDGVNMVLRQFTDMLKKHGVQAFSAMGETFDPNRHEAVAQREDPDAEPNTVIEEYQRGYMLNDRLVRPAMVIVSKDAPKVSAAQSSDDGPKTNEAGDEA